MVSNTDSAPSLGGINEHREKGMKRGEKIKEGKVKADEERRHARDKKKEAVGSCQRRRRREENKRKSRISGGRRWKESKMQWKGRQLRTVLRDREELCATRSAHTAGIHSEVSAIAPLEQTLEC